MFWFQSILWRIYNAIILILENLEIISIKTSESLSGHVLGTTAWKQANRWQHYFSFLTICYLNCYCLCIIYSRGVSRGSLIDQPRMEPSRGGLILYDSPMDNTVNANYIFGFRFLSNVWLCQIFVQLCFCIVIMCKLFNSLLTWLGLWWWFYNHWGFRNNSQICSQQSIAHRRHYHWIR